jgi:hypothetical protein
MRRCWEGIPLAVLLLAGGCVEESVPGRCASTDGRRAGLCAELGVGPRAEPVAEEGEIELVHGPQGGWHLEVGVRIVGEVPEGLVVSYRVRRANDDAVLGTSRFALSPRRLRSEGEYAVRSGDIVVLDVEHGSQVVGIAIELEMTLTDAAGATVAGDARMLTIVDRWGS